MSEKDKSFQKLEERTLVVRNFDPNLTTKELLEELFSNFGPINNVVLKRDFVFIGYTKPESVAYALAMMWGISLHGRRLNLSPKLSSESYYYRYLDSLQTFEQKCHTDKKFLDQFLSAKQHNERKSIVKKYSNSRKDHEKIVARLRRYRRHYDSDSDYNPHFDKKLLVDNDNRYGYNHHDRYNEFPEHSMLLSPPPSMQPYPAGSPYDHHYNNNAILSMPPPPPQSQQPIYDPHFTPYDCPPYMPSTSLTHSHQYPGPSPPGPYYDDYQVATSPPDPPMDYGYPYDGPPPTTREKNYRSRGRYR
nr:RNA-binding protein 7-like [Dermatophagoides farinae]